MRIVGILLSAVLCVGGVSGCKTRMTSCGQSNKDYAGAQELPPLKAPPGLETPSTRNSLKVPPLNTPERMRGKDEPCLDIPPPFASSKTSTPPPPAPAPVPPKPSQERTPSTDTAEPAKPQ
ncbi:MAG TPA: hypothetical protein VGQ27_13380 [Steroidobacteraceae bacterium]|jgi:uncharacterized lipoprotein|nr:hypothetical protein [Steroidobacteraceae bacterium]